MKPVDMVVLSLAVMVGVVVIASVVGAAVSGEYDERRGEVVKGLLASMIAIVSMYVGARLRDKE